MSYHGGSRGYMSGLLSTGAPDPVVPADGTQNITGNLNVSGTAQFGDNVTLTQTKQLIFGVGEDDYMSSPSDSTISVYLANNQRYQFSSSGFVVFDGIALYLGNALDASLTYDSTNQTVDTLVVGAPATSNHIIFCEHGDRATDWSSSGHAQATNPTLYIQSADATTVADFVAIYHDQTDGVIDTGAGTLNLGATGGVNLAGQSVTTATVTHDEYFEIEIAGVTKKVMLGS